MGSALPSLQPRCRAWKGVGLPGCGGLALSHVAHSRAPCLAHVGALMS